MSDPQKKRKFDFSDAPREAPDGDQMTVLRQLVKDLAAKERALDETKAALEVAKVELAEYRDHKVPDHAKSMGFGGGKVDDWDLNLKLGVYGGLKEFEDDPVALAQAFEYLESLGEGASIKRMLIVSLDRDSAAVETRIRQGLDRVAAQMKTTIEVEAKIGIHHSKLQKIARDRLEEGREIDLKRLGLVKVTRATVKTIE